MQISQLLLLFISFIALMYRAPAHISSNSVTKRKTIFKFLLLTKPLRKFRFNSFIPSFFIQQIFASHCARCCVTKVFE